MDNPRIDIFKECFQNISIKDLITRIKKYQTLSYSKVISEDTLREGLREIFKTIINGKENSFFLRNDVMTHDNQLYFFYRVRKFSSEDYKAFDSQPFPSMTKEQDAWWKPKEYSLKHGRLNRPNHSVLFI